MTGQPDVSLCMIVKNEAHCIGRCIKSVEKLVREIIVVDTGSTDRTIEIARGYGAKVMCFAWRDDFAAARNFSIARAAGEWILVLDADEVLEPVKPHYFSALLNHREVQGYYVRIRNYLDQVGAVAEDRVVRLFRNRPEYRFSGVIHEQIAGTILEKNDGSGLVLSGLVLHHYGCLEREVRGKNKRQRNMALLSKALAADPENPFLLYSMGMEHFQNREPETGVAVMEQALVVMRGSEGYYRDALIAMGLGLLTTGHTGRLGPFMDQALTVLPGDPDLRLLHGLCLLKERQYQQAIDKLRVAGGAGLLPPHRVQAILGDINYTIGRFDQAIREYSTALTLNCRSLHPLMQLIKMKHLGRCSRGWLEIARFTTIDNKKCLAGELVRLNKPGPSLAVALLAVLDAAASDSELLVETCRQYRAMLDSCTCEITFEGLWNEYLVAGAGEMFYFSLAARKPELAGILIDPMNRIIRIASDALELVAHCLVSPESGCAARSKTGEEDCCD